MLIRSKILFLGTLFLVGCATPPTAPLSSGNPNEAITEVEGIRNSARENQFDLLAKGPFEYGESRLENAREGLQSNDDKVNILKDLSEAKAYFLEAKKVANSRAVVPEKILSARKATLENGVRQSHELIQSLEEIDETLLDETNKFT